jgi:hypothetical protein
VTTRSNGSGAATAARGFAVYVEGPRDRDLLEVWAHRVSPRLARALVGALVILGGRQPARAVQDLRERRSAHPDARGLCVLDGDARAEREPEPEAGLAYYTWGRRHIESYLLVPAAIRRALGGEANGRLDRLLREHLSGWDDEGAMQSVDAKRLLDPRGPLCRHLERPLSPGQIARAMRVEEFHSDILLLLGQVREGLGVPEGVPSVAHRTGSLRG